MEYIKNTEEVPSSEEYRKNTEEYHRSAKEYFSTAEEYHETIKEKEYFIGETAKEKLTDNVKKKNPADFMKKIRKMGYLVAASVAVVMVTQTVEPTVLQDNGKQEYLSMAAYEDYSSANGGVFLVKENGLWGLMSITGEMLCEPKYNASGGWWAPNDDGYSVMSHNNNYYILDNQGEEVFVWDKPIADTGDIAITDNNIIFVLEDFMYTNDGMTRAHYWKVDGTKIYEVTMSPEDINAATPFNDGVAVITAYDDNGLSTDMLFETGVTKNIGYELYHWVKDAYADGYYLGESPEGMSLIDPQNPGAAQYFHPSFVVDKFAPEFMYDEAYIKGYYENGQYLFNYHTYGCIEAVQGEKTVNILFDYRDENWDTYNLDKVIAIYDNIVMDNFPYLCVQHEGDYFYIDWEGNVISDTYVMATAFNEDGYAMIMEKMGTAYLINERFKKLDTIENVTDIGTSGDAFGMEWNGELVIYVP